MCSSVLIFIIYWSRSLFVLVHINLAGVRIGLASIHKGLLLFGVRTRKGADISQYVGL